MSFTQANRPLAATTPLGTDKLLLTAFSGREALSQLFSYTLDLVAEPTTDVAFDKLLGGPIGVKIHLPGETARHFHGMCSRIAEGEQRQRLKHFRMEVVPKHWLLTRVTRCRIWQRKTVPEILKEVLTGLPIDFTVKNTFDPRDYCVQYRETDFDFASRLMEEEGIFYFFKHTEGVHTMVVANEPAAHVDVPVVAKLPFMPSGSVDRTSARVVRWETSQELRSGKVTLRDHCFEVPDKNLEASAPAAVSVAVGKVTLKTRLGVNTGLELYDFPGGYAQRYDGIDPGGGDDAGSVQRIFEDNKRTAELRMQEETAAAIVIDGAGTCAHFTAGHTFALEKHPAADGKYVLAQVRHSISYPWAPDRGSDQDVAEYSNEFACIPAALPFRPPRTTRKPVIAGAQTAVVVGPAGEEIFTDKYGRVHVKFPWSREAGGDVETTCWTRVGTPWAGQQWGIVHIPRIGQEVIVQFVEGDPDQPIVVGSVYNAAQMPPYELPDNKTQSGIKSRSSTGGSPETFNELRFEDKKTEEEIYFHAEKNFNRVVENNDSLIVGSSEADEGNQTIEVYKNRTETVKTGDETILIEIGNRLVTVQEGNETLIVGKGNRVTEISQGNETHTVMKGARTTSIDEGNETLTVGKGDMKVDVQTGRFELLVKDKHAVTVASGDSVTVVESGNQTIEVGSGNHELTVKSGSLTMKASAGAVSMEGGQSIELKVGGNSIKIDTSGITITGMKVAIEGQTQLDVKGLLANVTADGILSLKGALTKIG